MSGGAIRRVAVVTGTRADYGLLRPSIAALDADPRFELALVACAMHLSDAFGATVGAIEEDGFTVAARVETAPDDDAPGAFGRRLALATAGFSSAWQTLAPDVIVVLGDRYEMLAAALAASGAGVPVAHIHGGELSEGSLDDAMRHCITKLAHLHLVATREYGERVCQLGEQPERVHVVGAAAIESIGELDLLGEAQLASDIGPLTHPLAVVTLHPESLDPERAARDAGAVVAGIDAALGADATVIVTLPNDDPGNGATRDALTAWADRRAGVRTFDSLGQLRYLSLLSHADVVIGNSSSALIEAPEFRLPAVNVGDRQRGRVMAPNVIPAPAEAAAVEQAVRLGLSGAFRDGLAGMSNPYRRGAVSERLLAVLAGVTDAGALRRKAFLDLPDGPWRTTLEIDA